MALTAMAASVPAPLKAEVNTLTVWGWSSAASLVGGLLLAVKTVECVPAAESNHLQCTRSEGRRESQGIQECPTTLIGRVESSLLYHTLLQQTHWPG